jgi:hypothetical protein
VGTIKRYNLLLISVADGRLVADYLYDNMNNKDLLYEIGHKIG